MEHVPLNYEVLLLFCNHITTLFNIEVIGPVQGAFEGVIIKAPLKAGKIVGNCVVYNERHLRYKLSHCTDAALELSSRGIC